MEGGAWSEGLSKNVNLIAVSLCFMLLFCIWGQFLLSVSKAQANSYLRSDPLNYMRRPKQQSSQSNENTPNKWTSFCDFPEITHIAITGANVCISTQDNHCMVRVLVYPFMLEPQYINSVGKCACDTLVQLIYCLLLVLLIRLVKSLNALEGTFYWLQNSLSL